MKTISMNTDQIIKEQDERAAFEKNSQQWQNLQIRGDIQIISQIAGVSKPTISKAIKQGKGSVKTLRIVKQYFENRKKRLDNEQ